MGFANWSKLPVLAPEYTYGELFWKNGNLGELEHQGFIAFSVVDWVCYRFATVGLWRLWAWILWGGGGGGGERARKCNKENQEWR